MYCPHVALSPPLTISHHFSPLLTISHHFSPPLTISHHQTPPLHHPVKALAPQHSSPPRINPHHRARPLTTPHHPAPPSTNLLCTGWPPCSLAHSPHTIGRNGCPSSTWEVDFQAKKLSQQTGKMIKWKTQSLELQFTRQTSSLQTPGV